MHGTLMTYGLYMQLCRKRTGMPRLGKLPHLLINPKM